MIALLFKLLELFKLLNVKYYYRVMLKKILVP